MNTPYPLPSFLRPVEHDLEHSAFSPPSFIKLLNKKADTTRLALEQAMYPDLFVVLLDELSIGKTLHGAFDENNLSVDVGRFMRWVNRDPDRKQQFREAQRLGADFVDSQCILIADGLDSEIEDTQRSRLRYEARRKYLATVDRDRFGDVKQVDHTIHIDLSDAMNNANTRLVDYQEAELIEYNPADGEDNA